MTTKINISNDRIKKIIYEKINMCGYCEICKCDIPYEVYCYKCYDSINEKISNIDDKLDKLIDSMSYLDLNSLVSEIRQLHKTCCQDLFRVKRLTRGLSCLHKTFTESVKIEIFKSYKKLNDYAKRDLEWVFNNKKFKKKLELKFNLSLIDAKSVFTTDEVNYNYDKQLFITKIIENLKAMIEISMKSKARSHNPNSKTGKYMRFTKKGDGTLNQGKKYAYGKILDIIKTVNDDDIIQVFREFKIKNIVKGSTMFLDGLVFLKIAKNTYHPIVIELDDKTHDRLTEPNFRLNDLAKNIFCKKNGISIIRIDTIDFDENIFSKAINVIKNSSKAKLVAMKDYKERRISHFNKLENTYEYIKLMANH